MVDGSFMPICPESILIISLERDALVVDVIRKGISWLLGKDKQIQF